MAVAELLKRIASNATEAMRTFDQLAIDAVEGKKVTDKQIGDACITAGKPLSAFAARLSLLEKRKLACEAYHDRDWASEKEKRLDGQRKKQAEKESLEKEVEALRAELHRVGQEVMVAIRYVSALSKEEEDARHLWLDTLRKTGSEEDWRAVKGTDWNSEEGYDD